MVRDENPDYRAASEARMEWYLAAAAGAVSTAFVVRALVRGHRLKRRLPEFAALGHAASAGFLELTKANFDESLESEPLLLVDFWAEWCIPCHMLAPALARIQAELARRLRVAKLNVEQDPDVAARFKVKALPTLILFRNGRIAARVVGGRSEKRIMQLLRPHVGIAVGP
jgi:thioredoxin 1